MPAEREVLEHNGPLPGHVYYRRADKTPWSFIDLWKHPEHRDYHVNWTGIYVIVQKYGNFKNDIAFIELSKWDELFELAWEPLKRCAFCGFNRMRPCLTRQTCANLTDYRLEPDEIEDAPE